MKLFKHAILALIRTPPVQFQKIGSGASSGGQRRAAISERGIHSNVLHDGHGFGSYVSFSAIFRR